MSTVPEVCPVPTGCLARISEGLHVAGGLSEPWGLPPPQSGSQRAC